jgi:hypothetical protein
MHSARFVTGVETKPPECVSVSRKGSIRLVSVAANRGWWLLCFFSEEASARNASLYVKRTFRTNCLIEGGEREALRETLNIS